MSSVAALILSGSGNSTAQAPPPSARETLPGEGMLCLWAIYSVAVEVGAQCFPGKNPELQAELHRSVATLDRYVASSDPTWTPAAIAEFKRSQGATGMPRSQLCAGDAAQLFEAMAKTSPEKMRTQITAAVAQSGKPTWGDCI